MMVIKVGDIEINVTLMNPVKEIKDLKLEDFRGASISLYLPALSAPAPQAKDPEEPPPEADEYEDEEDALSTHAPLQPRRILQPSKNAIEAFEYLALLKQSQFTNQVITQAARKVLGVRTLKSGIPLTGEHLAMHFKEVMSAAEGWEQRKLNSEKIWAIYISPIQPPQLGKRLMAIGLDKENHYIILGLTDKTETDLYKDLQRRGLNTKSIEFGMLSFHAGPPKEFQKYFPNTKLARDWEEFIDMSEDESDQEDLKALMVNPNKKEVVRELKTFKGPSELLTYFDYPPTLWRVLRTASCVSKLDLELRSTTKSIRTPSELDFMVRWTLIRNQYQWLRLSQSAKHFQNFKYIKPVVEALK